MFDSKPAAQLDLASSFAGTAKRSFGKCVTSSISNVRKSHH